MSARLCLFALALSLLAGCASSPQAKTATVAPAPLLTRAVEPPPQVVDGTASQDERTTIQNSNSQIYGAEHAIDPDAGTVTNPQNQGIP
jgi:uncharacterized protein YcfL